MIVFVFLFFSFFFNDTATTEIYTLSLHDALPISNNKIYLTEKELFRQEQLKPETNRNERLHVLPCISA